MSHDAIPFLLSANKKFVPRKNVSENALARSPAIHWPWPKFLSQCAFFMQLPLSSEQKTDSSIVSKDAISFRNMLDKKLWNVYLIVRLILDKHWKEFSAKKVHKGRQSWRTGKNNQKEYSQKSKKKESWSLENERILTSPVSYFGRDLFHLSLVPSLEVQMKYYRPLA